MQDVELMHMRYTLESTVLALGAMERSMSDESASHQHVALCQLKDLKNHLEAITNIPRKVIFGLHHEHVAFFFADDLLLHIDCYMISTIQDCHKHI